MKNETILFIGDSITDCGRKGVEKPLGGGYVKLFRDLVIGRQPARACEIINKGIGGNKIADLAARWHEDALRPAPDRLIVLIGINDLFGKLNGDAQASVAAALGGTLEECLRRSLAAESAPRLLLLSPFYFSTERDGDSERSRVLGLVDGYVAETKRVATAVGADFIDLQARFDGIMAHHDPDLLCDDLSAIQIHPSLCGHLVIAEAVFDALAGS